MEKGNYVTLKSNPGIGRGQIVDMVNPESALGYVRVMWSDGRAYNYSQDKLVPVPKGSQ